MSWNWCAKQNAPEKYPEIGAQAAGRQRGSRGRLFYDRNLHHFEAVLRNHEIKSVLNPGDVK